MAFSNNPPVLPQEVFVVSTRTSFIDGRSGVYLDLYDTRADADRILAAMHTDLLNRGYLPVGYSPNNISIVQAEDGLSRVTSRVGTYVLMLNPLP